MGSGPATLHAVFHPETKSPNFDLALRIEDTDLTKLNDADLKTLIEKLEEEENELSFKRRLLHGKIDILRAELVSRLKNGKSELGQVDVARVSIVAA